MGFGPSLFRPPISHAYVPPGPHRRFSPLEIRHILISYSVLTLAFFLLWVRVYIIYGLTPPLLYVEVGAASGALAALTGFFAHEMAHKFTAQARGLWSEFRMSPQGLMMALLFSLLLGVLLAAPGATMIAGRGTREEAGITSIAGPGTNLGEAGICAGLLLALVRFGHVPWDALGLSILSYLVFINCVFAAFNMIPWGPLDGLKVWRWDKGFWVATMVGAIALGVGSFIYLPSWP